MVGGGYIVGSGIAGAGQVGVADNRTDSHSGDTGGGKGHTHSVTTTNTNTGGNSGNTTSVTATGTIGNTGNGNSINIQNPYITCYMWKRTA